MNALPPADRPEHERTSTRPVDLTLARSRLGRVGVWLQALGALPAEREREFVAQIEELGYATLWVNEYQREALTHAALVLSASTRLTVATGIASIWAREPETTAIAANTLAEAYDARFVLGLGIGHARFVERYRDPLGTTREYLGRMQAVASSGPQPVTPVPWVLAALRPKMLEIAATMADGSHPYFVPPDHTRFARDLLGPEPLLCPELAVVLDSDPATARATARAHMDIYLTLPNYLNNLRSLGFSDADFTGGGSNRLVDAIVAWGDTDAIKGRIEEHLAAGADHVCIQPLSRDGRLQLDELVMLAPILAD
jgi:probable F420-dependent oxidoreductase